MEFTKDTRNDLLKRREVTSVFDSSANPGYGGVLREVCKKEGISEDICSVKSLHGNYGSGEFIAEIFIYDDVDSKNKTEPKKKEKKK
ncbi:hypothetical protein COU60_02950 [Candidatus Pacearchaeota archaeon CG10_big_fil_rev_8_21_14_0_10_34_76]|nr:MAG: hypothetical protein COU60_02950 [Candidatus Pacearchaeota archaeon CG10_big_fil_rev_8_21_14_0_10_34_76]